jgi:hypothetical protein
MVGITKRATFRKTAFNMGRCLDGDWPMPFLVDEKVDIECPNARIDGQKEAAP